MFPNVVGMVGWLIYFRGVETTCPWFMWDNATHPTLVCPMSGLGWDLCHHEPPQWGLSMLGLSLDESLGILVMLESPAKNDHIIETIQNIHEIIQRQMIMSYFIVMLLNGMMIDRHVQIHPYLSKLIDDTTSMHLRSHTAFFQNKTASPRPLTQEGWNLWCASAGNSDEQPSAAETRSSARRPSPRFLLKSAGYRRWLMVLNGGERWRIIGFTLWEKHDDWWWLNIG